MFRDRHWKDPPNGDTFPVRAHFEALDEGMDQIELLSWRGTPKLLPRLTYEPFERFSLSGINLLCFKDCLELLSFLLQNFPLPV